MAQALPSEPSQSLRGVTPFEIQIDVSASLRLRKFCARMVSQRPTLLRPFGYSCAKLEDQTGRCNRFASSSQLADAQHKHLALIALKSCRVLRVRGSCRAVTRSCHRNLYGVERAVPPAFCARLLSTAARRSCPRHQPSLRPQHSSGWRHLGVRSQIQSVEWSLQQDLQLSHWYSFPL